MKYVFLISFSAIIAAVIIRMLKTSMLNRSWSYPLLLASLPGFYLIFAMWVNDKSSLKNEFVVGLLFFAIAIFYVRYRKRWAEYLLATGFILHSLYDISHDWFFINMGIPEGWPVFCATVNLFIGSYLLFLLKNNKALIVQS